MSPSVLQYFIFIHKIVYQVSLENDSTIYKLYFPELSIYSICVFIQQKSQVIYTVLAGFNLRELNCMYQIKSNQLCINTIIATYVYIGACLYI